MKLVNYWIGSWGDFIIPDDVPFRFRRDGWFDRRLKITSKLRAYFADMDARLRDDMPIQTWGEWCGTSS